MHEKTISAIRKEGAAKQNRTLLQMVGYVFNYLSITVKPWHYKEK
jgi:hypothetical protein